MDINSEARFLRAYGYLIRQGKEEEAREISRIIDPNGSEILTTEEVESKLEAFSDEELAAFVTLVSVLSVTATQNSVKRFAESAVTYVRADFRNRKQPLPSVTDVEQARLVLGGENEKHLFVEDKFPQYVSSQLDRDGLLILEVPKKTDGRPYKNESLLELAQMVNRKNPNKSYQNAWYLCKNILIDLTGKFENKFLPPEYAEQITVQIGFIKINLQKLYDAYFDSIYSPSYASRLTGDSESIEYRAKWLSNLLGISVEVVESLEQISEKDIGQYFENQLSEEFRVLLKKEALSLLDIKNIEDKEFLNFLDTVFLVLDRFQNEDVSEDPSCLKIKEIISLFINNRSYTREGDKLLETIFKKYSNATNLKYVDIFKILHRKTNSARVIASELNCRLFAHWGLRSVAYNSFYTTAILRKVEGTNNWEKVRITVPHGSQGKMLRSIFQQYGGLMFFEALSYFEIVDPNGKEIDLEEMVKTELSQHFNYSTIKDEEKMQLLSAYQIFIHSNGLSNAEVIDKYLKYVYGDGYKLTPEVYEMMTSQIERDSISFYRRSPKKIPTLKYETFFRSKLTKEGRYYRDINKLSDQQKIELIEILYAEKAKLKKEQAYPLWMMMTLAQGQKVRSNKVEISFENGDFLKTSEKELREFIIYNAYFPPEFYIGDDDEKKEFANLAMASWCKQRRMHFSTFINNLEIVGERGEETYYRFKQEFLGALIQARINKDDKISHVQAKISDLFVILGLQHRIRTLPDQFTIREIESMILPLCREWGIKNIPDDLGSYLIKHFKKQVSPNENKGWIYTVNDLSFEQVSNLLKASLHLNPGLRDQVLENPLALFDYKEETSLNLAILLGLENEGTIHVSIKELTQVFRKFLALRKKGLPQTSDYLKQITIAQSKTLIPNEELSDHVLSEIIGRPNIKTATSDQIHDLVENEHLNGVLASIGDDIHDLADYLLVFHQELVAKYGLDELVETLIKLPSNFQQDTQSFRQNSPAREEALTEAILYQLASMESPSEEVLRKIESIYRRILRRWISEDEVKSISWLQNRIEQTENSNLKIIFKNLLNYFKGYLDFQVPETITTRTLFPYQLEAVRYFSSEDVKRGILADEPGMGKTLQAIGVAESIGADKVLWVTTNSNKESVKNELLKHTNISETDILIIDAAKLKSNPELVNSKKYIIVNYEALRGLEEEHPQAYYQLTKNLDLTIIDEGQLGDNVESQQGLAINRISEASDRLLMLSATPVQHRFERIYNILKMIDPETFGKTSLQAFKDKYIARGLEGYLDLHHLLQKYMLRRRKKDSFKEADPNLPLSGQKRVLPKQVDVDHYENGGFLLSIEQSNLIVKLVTDLEGFLDEYEEVLGIEDREKFLRRPALYYYLQMQIVKYPEKFGLMENPRKNQLKKMLKEFLLDMDSVEIKKPIIWAHEQRSILDIISVIQELENDPDIKALYPEGVSFGRYDGSSEATKLDPKTGLLQREIDLQNFQKGSDAKPQIMIASYMAGGVGLTMTAGNPAVFYEQPNKLTEVIQAYDRNHRVDGRFPRYVLEYFRTIAMYPPGLIDSIENEDVREFLLQGTVEERRERKINHRLKEYKVLLDGLMVDDDISDKVEDDLSTGIEDKIKDLKKKKVVVKYGTSRAQNIANRGLQLLETFKRYQNEDQKRQAVVELVTLLKEKKIDLEALKVLLTELGEGELVEEALEAPLSLRKKYFSQRFLKNFFILLDLVHAANMTVEQVLETVFFDELTDEAISIQQKSLILPLLLISQNNFGQAKVVFDSLISIEDRQYKNYWSGRLFVAFDHLSQFANINSSIDFMSVFSHPDWRKSDATKRLMIESLYAFSQIALVALPSELRGLLDSFSDPFSFYAQLKKACWDAVDDFIETDDGIKADFKMQFQNDPLRILAVLNGLQTDASKAAVQSKEELQSYFRLLNKGISPDKARKYLKMSFSVNGIELQKTREFQILLGEFEKKHTSRYESIVINSESIEEQKNKLQEKSAYVIDQYYLQISKMFEAGSELAFIIKKMVNLSSHYAKKSFYSNLNNVIHELKSGEEISSEQKEFLSDLGLNFSDVVKNQEYYFSLFFQARKMASVFTALKNEKYDANTLKKVRSILNLSELDEESLEDIDQIEFVVSLKEIESSLELLSDTEKLTYQNIQIEDVDDPQYFMMRGDFHESISNCLASDGAPYYLKALTTALGSRTQRIMVVKSGDEVMALCVLKLRTDSNGRPVYYVEIPIFKGDYDFRNELLAHVIEKSIQAKGMVPKVSIFDKASRGLAGEKEMLHSLGGYGYYEYEEALYRPQQSAKLIHKAKTVFDPNQRQIDLSSIEKHSGYHKLKDFGVLKSERSLVKPTHAKTASLSPNIINTATQGQSHPNGLNPATGMVAPTMRMPSVFKTF